MMCGCGCGYCILVKLSTYKEDSSLRNLMWKKDSYFGNLKNVKMITMAWIQESVAVIMAVLYSDGYQKLAVINSTSGCNQHNPTSGKTD